MQQQAVGLVCAALGVGMVFKNIGKDGTSFSDTDYGTINIRLDPMKPAYGGSFWNNLAPADPKPWLRGNLPDPVRDGHKPLISILTNLKTENKRSVTATEQSISQLLWAARGRRPHLYKSRPWGLTIPTWAGEQNISSVYLISGNRLSRYINWDKNQATHALRPLTEIESRRYEALLKSFAANRALVLLGKNEGFSRALWEVGYQLLNLMLQASSLDISYRAFLLDEAQRTTLEGIGVNDPVAVLVI